jgi:hypothetical protein
MVVLPALLKEKAPVSVQVTLIVPMKADAINAM